MRTPRPALIALGVVLVQGLLLVWFAWPARTAAPHDLPIVVAGPAPAAHQVGDRLPAEFSLTYLADAVAADAALRDRAAYGAFVVGPDGLSLHIATAASPAVATALTQAAPAGTKIVDVVPLPSGDRRGAGFSVAFLPLLLTSIVAGALLALLVPGWRTRVAALAGYGALAGLSTTALMHANGLLGGSYLAGAGAVGLLALAIAGTVAGFAAILGRPGIALGAVLVFVVGNPLSGLAAAPELLPRPWGAIGQFLPPGAGVSLVRSVGFFDGAAALQPALVLIGYSLIGLIMVAVGGLRTARTAAAASAPEREPALAY